MSGFTDIPLSIQISNPDLTLLLGSLRRVTTGRAREGSGPPGGSTALIQGVCPGTGGRAGGLQGCHWVDWGCQEDVRVFPGHFTGGSRDARICGIEGWWLG